ncbi:SDR family NAD(P)-dependent oxidoreductase, partial [Oleiphilus sp. HI0079]
MSGYQSVLKEGLFEGKTIIVTGGGSGIGRCTAHELASLGAHVALVGRKIEKLEAVKAEIEEDGGSAEAHACDIRDEDAVKTCVKAIKQN